MVLAEFYQKIIFAFQWRVHRQTEWMSRTFNGLINRVMEVYEPIVSEQGKSLVVERNWTSDTFNASARRLGSTWMVTMYGGLARHPAVTYDAFMLVMCHELGHHMGGAPKIGGILSPNKWASNEGQSDYWGSNKCLKRVLSKDDNQAWMKLHEAEIDATAKESCDRANRDDVERALCTRVAMAGKSLGDAFAAMGGGSPKFSTPDPKTVKKTNHRHPAAQCRLDTYFHGALCTKSMLDPVSDDDPKRGFCHQIRRFRIRSPAFVLVQSIAQRITTLTNFTKKSPAQKSGDFFCPAVCEFSRRFFLNDGRGLLPS